MIIGCYCYDGSKHTTREAQYDLEMVLYLHVFPVHGPYVHKVLRLADEALQAMQQVVSRWRDG